MANAKDLGARVVNTIHRSVFQATKGRVFGKVYGMPVLILTTTGRKSGQPRTTMLTTPTDEDGNPVIIASYGGDDRHPAWYLNLRENPDVEIIMGGEKQAKRARIATAEEKERIWPRVTSGYKGYAGYQERTDRDIPVVILEPR